MAIDLTMGGYFAVIPAPVLYDPHLRPRAKLLYGEIVRLSSATGFCYAKNSFLLGVCTYVDEATGVKNSISERTLQSMLAELREYGHIRMDMGSIPGRNKETGRRIFIGQALTPEPAEKEAAGGAENCTPCNFLRQRGEENCTPYISLQNTRTNTPIAPKDVLKRCEEYAAGDRELYDALCGLLDNRRHMPKPKPVNTVRAMDGILRDLDKLSGGNRDLKLRLLEKATLSNWLTVYPLKRDELPAAVPTYEEDEIDGI